MSRGFVKEDDQEEAPFVPPRAPLPEGVANYVTPRGLERLLHERRQLEEQRATTGGSDQERRRMQAEVDGRLALLNERIQSARSVEPDGKPPVVVRFGTTVTFVHQAGRLKDQTFTFTITGVDEANVKEGSIAFTAPLARALMGKRKGQLAELELGSDRQRLKITAISQG
ncbi:MAG: GreA/GreB family elongation factor [Flavobacteriales bacterium]